jgi:hypothetical protein
MLAGVIDAAAVTDGCGNEGHMEEARRREGGDGISFFRVVGKGDGEKSLETGFFC